MDKLWTFLKWVWSNSVWDLLIALLRISPAGIIAYLLVRLAGARDYPEWVVFVAILLGVLIGVRAVDILTLRRGLGARLEEVVGSTIQNRLVVLDGHSYVDCQFVNVTLRWNGGAFKIFRCKLQGTTHFETQNRSFVELIDLLKALGFLEPAFSASWQHRGPEYFRQ